MPCFWDDRRRLRGILRAEHIQSHTQHSKHIYLTQTRNPVLFRSIWNLFFHSGSFASVFWSRRRRSLPTSSTSCCTEASLSKGLKSCVWRKTDVLSAVVQFQNGRGHGTLGFLLWCFRAPLYRSEGRWRNKIIKQITPKKVLTFLLPDPRSCAKIHGKVYTVAHNKWDHNAHAHTITARVNGNIFTNLSSSPKLLFSVESGVLYYQLGTRISDNGATTAGCVAGAKIFFRRLHCGQAAAITHQREFLF